jgi:hypothetical protein
MKDGQIVDTMSQRHKPRIWLGSSGPNLTTVMWSNWLVLAVVRQRSSTKPGSTTSGNIPSLVSLVVRPPELDVVAAITTYWAWGFEAI